MTEERTPSPAVAAYLARSPLRSPMTGRDVDGLRLEHRTEALNGAGDPPPVPYTNIDLASSVSGRLYRPDAAEREIMIWFHGGGWALGDLDCCDAVARALANDAGCAVLTVAYRLAPEYQFPAAVEDAWAATRWAAARSTHVAVGGDSAGGNLAAVVARRARDADLEIALQMLVYPVLDWRPDSYSYSEFAARYRNFAGKAGFGAWYQDSIRYLWQTYCPGPEARVTPDASPLRAPDLEGVAPALIISAEHDVLRLENEEYADRLRASGVDVETLCYPGQIHGFFELQGAFDDARDAMKRAAERVRHAFAVSNPGPPPSLRPV